CFVMIFAMKAKITPKRVRIIINSPARCTGLKIYHPFGAILGQCQKERIVIRSKLLFYDC
ncbi:MAG TPA: hypothetical protein P5235_02500, partial [Saprospiraceae bacterium]|nr:hypothetical protein [Saprospiraceae bacterium]